MRGVWVRCLKTLHACSNEIQQDRTGDADSTALPAEHSVPAHVQVLKKTVEVLGQEEPSMVDYVMSLVKQHKQPAQMVDTLSAIMDNETEPFVLNLFRLIIMESEKAAQGLL